MRDWVLWLGKMVVSVLLFPFKMLLKMGQKVWYGWGRLGLWLRQRLARAGSAIWGFIGRVGLAFRNILRLVIWKPLLFITTPFRWIYRKIFARPVGWLGRKLFALWTRLALMVGWMGRKLFAMWTQLALATGWVIVRPIKAGFRGLIGGVRGRWANGATGRKLRRRRWGSHWQIAKARLRLYVFRPRPPRDAVIAPSLPRPHVQKRRTRLATIGGMAVVLLVVSFVTVQQAPRLGRAVADDVYVYDPDLNKPSEVVETVEPSPIPPTATPIPPTPWPTPDPLDGGGSVAFTLRQNGQSDIYALSIGQSQPVRLTSHPADDRDPAWSPDGSELAFASRRDGNWELYVLNMVDGQLRRLTDDLAFDAGPSWSPDGQWLVFESYRDENLDLYIVSSDGREGPIRLTEDATPDFSPVWSPEGRHIAFTSWRSGNKDIFVMPLDAASDETAVNVTGSPDLFEDYAAFNPAGTELAFSDDSTGFDLVYSVALVDSFPAGEPMSRGQGYHPSWSPDGEALAYIHSSETQSHLIASTLDAWSVAPQAFTANGLLDDPDWSAVTLPIEMPPHLQAMNGQTDEPLFVETMGVGADVGATALLLQLPVNAPAPYLSDGVDQSFLQLRERVTLAVGWDFLGELDHVYEPIDTRPLPGQSDETWNKAGRAFDFYARHVLSFDPPIEVVRENGGSALYWRTFVRATAQDGSQGEPLRDLPWDFRARFGAEPQFYDQGGKWREGIPAGYYLDFTELAGDYGWQRVAADDNWRTFFPGIRFWHYENRQGLTWEAAMLEIYTADEFGAVFGR